MHDLPWASPSRILDSVVETPDYLMRWAWKLGRDGIPLEEAQATGKRGGIGVHDAIERMTKAQLQGLPWRPEDPMLHPPANRGAIEALNKWWQRRRPKVVGTELNVASPEWRVRGRVDLVVECESYDCCGGDRPHLEDRSDVGVVIVDGKTKSVAALKNHLQVGGFYPLLWQTDPARTRKVCGSFILGLNIDGSCDAIEIPPVCTPGDAIDAIRWYRQAEARRASATARADEYLTPGSQTI